MTEAAILAEYDQNREVYAALGPRLEALVGELLAEHDLPVHTITHRVKARENLMQKLTDGGRDYRTLSGVTDVLGIRIITFFPSDVDRVADVIRAEFSIDEENSIDKREQLAADTFGYMSLHFVGALSDARLRLLEYKRFSDCCFEIQIRSILQHAWAEIEHDLGYKSDQELPRYVRRRFSQIAGLLEVADDSFDAIRRELREYEQGVGEALASDPEEVFIDRASLFTFVASDPLVQQLDAGIGGAIGRPVVPVEGYAGPLAKQLQFFDLETIAQVKRALEQRQELIVRFAATWLTRPRTADEDVDTEIDFTDEDFEEEDDEDFDDDVIEEPEEITSFSAGISLFYLSYLLAAESESQEVIKSYLDFAGIGGSTADTATTADELLTTYRESLGPGAA